MNLQNSLQKIRNESEPMAMDVINVNVRNISHTGQNVFEEERISLLICHNCMHDVEKDMQEKWRHLHLYDIVQDNKFILTMKSSILKK